jgi:hypothetical protein
LFFCFFFFFFFDIFTICKEGNWLLLEDKISSAKDSRDRHENKPTAAPPYF